jgi:hypothetical protein
MPVDFNHPLIVGVVSFCLLSLVAWIGFTFLSKRRSLEEAAREDIGVILSATLTLLALIIGFSFSMAISRYDQRKNLEGAEANAIGTQFVRAGLLPPADAVKVRSLLKSYLDERIRFYLTRDERPLATVNARTAVLQRELWAAVQAPAAAQPNPVVALVVAGMNDVLNSQGYTQAAVWNRIPHSAWWMMAMIAACCNLLLGYGSRNTEGGRISRIVMPLIVAVAFMLIADIDSPRGGLIHVYPQNLQSLSASLSSR